MLIKAIKEYSADKIEIFQQPAGVHTLVRIASCTNQEELLEKMRAESIQIYGIKENWQDKKEAKEDVFLMGFNSMSEEDIRNGCKKMAQVICKNYKNIEKRA